MEHPGVESIEGVCGGAACIAGRRIPVWMLELGGVVWGQVKRSCSKHTHHLRTEDLTDAWSYVQNHADEINRQIQENEE